MMDRELRKILWILENHFNMKSSIRKMICLASKTRLVDSNWLKILVSKSKIFHRKLNLKISKLVPSKKIPILQHRSKHKTQL